MAEAAATRAEWTAAFALVKLSSNHDDARKGCLKSIDSPLLAPVRHRSMAPKPLSALARNREA
jgi:hypothetical protein